MLPVFSRRKFVSALARRAGVVFSTAVLLAGCERKKEASQENPQKQGDFCKDFSGVSENDLVLRKKFAYVEESPIADNQCNNCNLFLPPKTERDCGGCMLFKGPVYKSGYCTYWAPKV